MVFASSVRQKMVDSTPSCTKALPETLCGARKRERGMQVCWWLLQAWRKVGTQGGEDLMKGTQRRRGEGEADSLAPQLFGKTRRLLWKTQDVGMQAGRTGLDIPPSPTPNRPHTHAHTHNSILALNPFLSPSSAIQRSILALGRSAHKESGHRRLLALTWFLKCHVNKKTLFQ